MGENDDSKLERARRLAEFPGREWRLLAHKESGDIEVRNEGVFDELVVDHWLHIEQLGDREWWMRVGDARVLVAVEIGGAVRIDVERGFYSPTVGTTSSE
ncbi:hypothetical protein [Pyxidicoccus xibeiensis]|uniref:hypothetical protein n=1 Tax=Pyxidicoccus xibeiensis TaxID=2906759 RepID=UPI0020A79EE7|nr:hypothetical protein [Pyxidicoccus xibeiensis]MCP3139189.1 hypothetical protein [Pyxidicoccus xibeiensis]